MASYIGIIHKDAASDFGVNFPDFPGCVTAGATLDQAGRMAQEALAGHIATLREFGEAIPEPMPLDQARTHEFAENAAAFIVVHVDDPEESRTVRVNITLRESDLKKIDAAAQAQHLSRSYYLVQRALRS